jgi:hypothetical protein
MALSSKDNIIEIPYREDGRLTLPMFSKTYVHVYEGTKLYFNIVDSDNSRIVLTRNSILIKEIRNDSIRALLSVNREPETEIFIDLGEIYKVKYDYEFMPYMTIQPMTIRSLEDKKNRETLLFFEVPFLKDSKKYGKINENLIAIDPSLVQTEKENEENIRDPKIIIMIAVIVILVAAILFLLFKKRQ